MNTSKLGGITMTEDYISLETAKLLKEKRFDIETRYFYNEGSGWKRQSDSIIKTGSGEWVNCPTQALVVKWLLQKHNIFVETLVFDIGFLEKGKFCFQWRVYNNTENWATNTTEYKMPEEATEAAIQYCLKNLIE